MAVCSRARPAAGHTIPRRALALLRPSHGHVPRPFANQRSPKKNGDRTHASDRALRHQIPGDTGRHERRRRPRARRRGHQRRGARRDRRSVRVREWARVRRPAGPPPIARRAVRRGADGRDRPSDRRSAVRVARESKGRGGSNGRASSSVKLRFVGNPEQVGNRRWQRETGERSQFRAWRLPAVSRSSVRTHGSSVCCSRLFQRRFFVQVATLLHCTRASQHAFRGRSGTRGRFSPIPLPEFPRNVFARDVQDRVGRLGMRACGLGTAATCP